MAYGSVGSDGGGGTTTAGGAGSCGGFTGSAGAEAVTVATALVTGVVADGAEASVSAGACRTGPAVVTESASTGGAGRRVPSGRATGSTVLRTWFRPAVAVRRWVTALPVGTCTRADGGSALRLNV